MRTLVLLFMTLAAQARGWTLVGAGLAGWETRLVAVHLNSEHCPVSQQTLEQAIDQALAVWNHAPGSGIRLTRALRASDVTVDAFLAIASPATPVILCDREFGRHNAMDPDYVPAATRVSASGSRLDYAGILLNAESGKGATIDKLKDGQLTVTIAHELGHVLGLGHSDVEDALMYFSVHEKTEALLSADDLAGLSFLYPKNELTAGPLGCAKMENAPEGALSTLIVLLGIAGFVAINIAFGRWWRARCAPPVVSQTT